MVDLTQWSDEQLKALESGMGKAPADMSDDELLAHSAYHNNTVPETKPKPASISLSDAKAQGLSDQQYEQRAKDYIEGQYGGPPSTPGVIKAFATGAGPGTVAGLRGMPGNVERMYHVLAGKMHGTEPAPNWARTSGDFKSEMENQGVPFYEPQNFGERAAETMGGLASMGWLGAGPRALTQGTSLLARILQPAAQTMAQAVRSSVAPGLLIEGAGEGAKAAGIPEAPVRFATALAAPGLARKLTTPNTLSPEQTSAITALGERGIPVNPDQILGRTIPRGVPEYTENMMRDEFGVSGANPRSNPATFTSRFKELGKDYEDIARRNTLTNDPPIPHGQPVPAGYRNLNTEFTDYYRRMNEAGHLEDATKNLVNQHLNRIGNLAGSNRGTLPGSDFHDIVSSIKQDQRAASKAGDYQRSGALSELNEILDSGMERSMRRAGNTADAEKWAQTNRHYRNGLALEDAAKPNNVQAALGYLDPQKVANSIDQVHGKYALTRSPSRMARTTADAVAAEVGKGAPQPPGFFDNILQHHLPLAGVVGGEGVGAAIDAATGSHLGPLWGGMAGAVAAGVPAAMVQSLKSSGPGEAYRLNQLLPHQAFREMTKSDKAAQIAKWLNQTRVATDPVRALPGR